MYIYIYIYIYIYVCKVRKSRPNNHKTQSIVQLENILFCHLIFDMINMSSTDCSDNVLL